MRKLLCLSILFLISIIGKAQKVYFIYLESENATPFYVKMGDRIYSSSSAGYLILSNLVDSTYGFSIGLSGKREAEPRFQVAITSSDHGFLIKELDKKLSLFDLQSHELIAPLAAVETNTETYITRSDNFTRILSLALNDPSLLLEAVHKEPVKTVAKSKTTPKGKDVPANLAVVTEVVPEKTVAADSSVQTQHDTTALATISQTSATLDSTGMLASSIAVDSTGISDTMQSKDIAIVVDTTVVADTAIKRDTTTAIIVTATEQSLMSDSVIVVKADTASLVTATLKEDSVRSVEPEYKRSTVVRRSESSTTEGFGLTFIDFMGGTSDTVRLLIPNQKPVFKSSTVPPVKLDSPKVIPDIETSTVIDTVTQVDTTAKADTVVQVQKTNSACAAVATDQDFKDLQKDMASLYTDAGKVNIAVEAFKKQCYSTAQVKSLSALFSSPQWKYLFFEAAQKYIADTESFASLESEIKDDYYIYKFKALLAK